MTDLGQLLMFYPAETLNNSDAFIIHIVQIQSLIYYDVANFSYRFVTLSFCSIKKCCLYLKTMNMKHHFQGHFYGNKIWLIQILIFRPVYSFRIIHSVTEWKKIKAGFLEKNVFPTKLLFLLKWFIIVNQEIRNLLSLNKLFLLYSVINLFWNCVLDWL